MMVQINRAERLKVDVSLMNLHIGHIFRILIFSFFHFFGEPFRNDYYFVSNEWILYLQIRNVDQQLKLLLFPR